MTSKSKSREKSRPIKFIIAAYAILFLILGLTDTFSKLKDFFTPKTVNKGLLAPQEVQIRHPDLEFHVGRQIGMVAIKELYEGIEFKPFNMVEVNGRRPMDMTIKQIDYRLFVKKAIYDYRGRQLGDIDYKEWFVNDDQPIGEFFATDSSLEIVDDRDMVVFGLYYKFPNKIITRGYESSQAGCFVLSDSIYVAEMFSTSCDSILLANKHNLKPYGKPIFPWWRISLALLFIVLIPFMPGIYTWWKNVEEQNSLSAPRK